VREGKIKGGREEEVERLRFGPPKNFGVASLWQEAER